MAVRTVGVKLTAETTGFISRMKAAEQSVGNFQKKLADSAGKGHLDNLANSAGSMGLALAGGFAYAVKSAADFDKQMSAVSAATNATAGDMKKLRDAALEAGKSTQYSATDAAKGITELGKAGVATQDVLNGGLKGALSLAAAGQIDVGEAAETAASAMTQFKLSGDKVPHVADLLAAAAGKAQGSVHDMGQALNQAGLVASQTGLTIEETTGGLAAFANAGLIGSDAGTSFKQMLLMLQAPSGKTKDLMNELGISMYDNQGKFIGLAKFAGQLKDKLKDLTPQARSAAMAQIFGADATRAASIMYEQGADGIQKWIDKTNDVGFAQDTAAKLTDNLAGDIERLKGSIETMAIEAGSGANNGLRVLVQGLGKLVDLFGQLPGGVTATLTVMAGIGGALLLAGAAWVKLRRTIADTAEELRQVGPAGEKAARGLERGSKAAGKAAIAFVALEAVSLGIKALTDNAPNVERLTKAMQEFALSGKVTGELSEHFGKGMEDLGLLSQYADSADHGFWKMFNTIQSGIPVLGDLSDAVSEGVFGTSFNDATEKMGAFDAALTSAMESTKDSAKASSLWAKVVQESGLSADELTKRLPNAHAKMMEMDKAFTASKDDAGQLNAATRDLSTSQEKFTTTAEAAKGALEGQRAAFTKLSEAMKAETDPIFGLLDAQTKLTGAQKAANKAIKEHGRNSTEAKDATRDLALAAINLQEKAGGLSSTFNGEMSPALRATLKAAKLTDQQIDDLGKQFIDAKNKAQEYDGNYKANATAPGAIKAKTELDKASAAANRFEGPRVAEINVTGAQKAAERLIFLNKLQAALKKGTSVGNARALAGDAKAAADRNMFAEGGWTGPGDKYDPAGVVHADEFVVQKKSRQRFESKHPGALDHINRTGELPGYAGGGMVWPYPTTAAGTQIPSQKSIEDGSMGPMGNAGPAGAGWQWMVRAVKAAFPGIGVLSTFRKNSTTLSGNRSYHASGRAVDFSPSLALAQWVNANYFGRTKELITPWNNLNIHNGKRHTYTGAVWNQHNFAGGNAHDHWAMAHGGVIPEPVFGVGKSGRTYSFGEMGPERVLPHYASGGYVGAAASSAPSKMTLRASTDEALMSAAAAVQTLTEALKQNGSTWKTTTQAGRENRSALIGGIKAAQAAAQAKFDETKSVSKANAAYDQYLKMLDNSLKSMGINAKGRKELLKAYSERPKYDIPAPDSASRIGAMQGKMSADAALDSAKQAFAWTRPGFDSRTETGRAELSELFSYLSAAQSAAQGSFDLNGDAKSATKLYYGYLSQLKVILKKSGKTEAEVMRLFELFGKFNLQSKANRYGGLYEHAASGVLKEALIAGGGATQYAWAEPSTGGELFAPKYGNLAKTKANVTYAVENWWGGRDPWGAQKSGPVVVHATIPITLGAEVITRQVRFEVDTAVGQIANATIYQTA